MRSHIIRSINKFNYFRRYFNGIVDKNFDIARNIILYWNKLNDFRSYPNSAFYCSCSACCLVYQGPRIIHFTCFNFGVQVVYLATNFILEHLTRHYTCNFLFNNPIMLTAYLILHFPTWLTLHNWFNSLYGFRWDRILKFSYHLYSDFILNSKFAFNVHFVLTFSKCLRTYFIFEFSLNFYRVLGLLHSWANNSHNIFFIKSCILMNLIIIRRFHSTRNLIDSRFNYFRWHWILFNIPLTFRTHLTSKHCFRANRHFGFQRKPFLITYHIHIHAKLTEMDYGLLFRDCLRAHFIFPLFERHLHIIGILPCQCFRRHFFDYLLPDILSAQLINTYLIYSTRDCVFKDSLILH